MPSHTKAEKAKQMKGAPVARAKKKVMKKDTKK